MIAVFAVMMEGRVPFFSHDRAENGKPYISVSSYWLTREEAEYALNRRFENFGTWTPKRRWIEERNLRNGQRDLISNLDYGRPEYALAVA